MTTFELRLNLSDRLAREARAAGLLTPQALAQMVKDAVRKQAANTLLAGAARASKNGGRLMSMMEIQAEVDAVRRVRQAGRRSGKRA